MILVTLFVLHGSADRQDIRGDPDGVRLLLEFLGLAIIPVWEVHGGAGMARVEDDGDFDALGQIHSHDAMHFIVSDEVSVGSDDGFVFAVVLMATRILFHLAAVTRKGEEKTITGHRAMHQSFHRFHNVRFCDGCRAVLVVQMCDVRPTRFLQLASDDHLPRR